MESVYFIMDLSSIYHLKTYKLGTHTKTGRHLLKVQQQKIQENELFYVNGLYIVPYLNYRIIENKHIIKFMKLKLNSIDIGKS